jgi:hypothetical protein
MPVTVNPTATPSTPVAAAIAAAVPCSMISDT